MGASNALALVMADIVVIALTIAVLMVLVLVVYLCIQIALRAARSLRPAARRPARVTADAMIAALDAAPDLSDGIDPRTWREVYDAGLVDASDVARAFALAAELGPDGRDSGRTRIGS